jgi:anaerobic selenocysteine-containing dehydrogenase
MSETKHTICRACHAGCSVLVEFQNGLPVNVRGNKAHPLFQGYCCVKGQNTAAQWANPNRLLHSQKRQPDGSYAAIGSEQAMDEIAADIKRIIGENGVRSFATYSGSMAALGSAASSPVFNAWMSALGSPMAFSSNTIDQPGKMVANALHGYWMAPPQNFANAKVALLIGCNPLTALSGGLPYTNPGKHLGQALRDGLKLIVIDPRRSDTAGLATLHLQPRPGEDVTILAGFLRVIFEEKLYDGDFSDENVTGIAQLRQAVSPFTPAYVAARADIPAADLVAAARIFASNGPGVAVAGTGPNMSGHTTLFEYLVLCLNTICGRWLRAGEQVTEPGSLGQQVTPKAQAAAPMKDYAYGFGEQLRVRGLGNTAAGMPTAALPDEILMPGPKQVRALISHGGNPVAAFPDQERTLEAMRALELLVQIDILMSATAREAHYVIAVKHPLEIPGMTLPQEYYSAYAPGFGTTAAHAQYTPAVAATPADSDLIEDWEFFYGLAQRLGLELAIQPIAWAGTVAFEPYKLDMKIKPTTDAIFEIITTGSRIPLSEVKKYPGGALFADPPVFVAAKDAGWEARLDVGDAQMLNDLGIAAGESWETDSQRPFRLVCRRQMNVYNSVGQDLPGQVRQRPYNPAFMHPDDLTALGLHPGDAVEIRSEIGGIPGIAQADGNLRRGLVSMAHAWGGAPELDSKFRELGSNTSRLTMMDKYFERYTGLPRMSNIPVQIRPLF